ncbi:MAG TPA: prepilin-type N-terminal cleavage/methylation domain-containing protein [Pyrinomonadaceae bacterium]|jgi:prepilin-type N-terminal cleavage/methylation domain-containing protein|nr:prepilin-type N-terminal cleavage/methylation domain-containing protein [Pyrinomonadaceae bacterium]
MKKNTQNGFSLIELLLVVTILGIVTAIGIPSFQKGIRAADNGAAFATLRSMSSTQVSFFSQNNRFARLTELNALHGNGLGTLSGNSITRGRFVFEMSPLTPTDAELKEGYTILASGVNGVNGTPFVFRVSQTGEIFQVTP